MSRTDDTDEPGDAWLAKRKRILAYRREHTSDGHPIDGRGANKRTPKPGDR